VTRLRIVLLKLATLSGRNTIASAVAGDLGGSSGSRPVAPAIWRSGWWRGGGFAANVAVMLTGTVLGQTASVLLAPVLTRLYLPEQFGYLGVYTAALTVLSVVAALGFELAIPIAASDAELANLVACSGLALVGMTSLLSLAAWLMSDRVLDLIWLSPLGAYRFLLPIGFACVGSYYVMVAAATRMGAFRAIASTRLSQGLSGPLSQILFGMLGAGAPGLALGFVIGQSSGTLLLFSRVVLGSARLMPVVSWRGVLTVARRYAKFPLEISAFGQLVSIARHGRQWRHRVSIVFGLLFD
jgi:O-antigen/teichoic acid export membrane protein